MRPTVYPNWLTSILVGSGEFESPSTGPRPASLDQTSPTSLGAGGLIKSLSFQLSTASLQLRIHIIVFNVLVGKKRFEPMKFGLGGRLSIRAEIPIYELVLSLGFEPRSLGRKPWMIGHYTTRAYVPMAGF